ncbi:MAG: phage major capsid protein [Planctomycetota bacterium]
MSTPIKAKLEERASKQKHMRQLLDNAKAEKRDLTTEEAGKFDELSEETSKLTIEIGRDNRMAEIEAEGRNLDPIAHADHDGTAGNPNENRDADEGEIERRYAEAVDRFYRQGREALTDEQRNAIVKAEEAAGLPDEVRALSASGIGAVGTQRLYKALVDEMAIYDGVREAGATVLTTTDGNPMPIPTGSDTSKGEVIGENPGAGGETGSQDPAISNAPLNVVTISSKKIGVSFQLLQDNSFNVEGYVADKAQERIGRKNNELTTIGSTGVVTRAGKSVDAANVAAFSYDDFLSLRNGVDAAYWKSKASGFMFSQTTATDAQKLKDNEGRPIWSPAFGDQPERLHGHRMTLNNELHDYDQETEAATDPLAVFGDFKRYILRDVTRPYMIRDPYTLAAQGLVVFLLFSRHGGNTGDPQAFAKLVRGTAA